MQELLTKLAMPLLPMPAAQTGCLENPPKDCAMFSSSPQLGDYSAQVHQTQYAFHQTEKMLGMPLDGERTAVSPQRRKAARHSEPARQPPAVRERRKIRHGTETRASTDKPPAEAGSPEAAALLFVNAFGISPTLARFAVAFVHELKLRAACAAIGIGYETGRTYLKQIFHKTDTHSQAQLAVLLVKILAAGRNAKPD